VVTRKNAYGSRNEDPARLAARVWTVTATAEMAGLGVLTYLTAYLDACGRNSGKPLAGPDLERFLPRTRRPGRLGTATPARLTPARLFLQPRLIMKPAVVA
jgi:transposase